MGTLEKTICCNFFFTFRFLCFKLQLFAQLLGFFLINMLIEYITISITFPRDQLCSAPFSLFFRVSLCLFLLILFFSPKFRPLNKQTKKVCWLRFPIVFWVHWFGCVCVCDCVWVCENMSGWPFVTNFVSFRIHFLLTAIFFRVFVCFSFCCICSNNWLFFRFFLFCFTTKVVLFMLFILFHCHYSRIFTCVCIVCVCVWECFPLLLFLHVFFFTINYL